MSSQLLLDTITIKQVPLAEKIRIIAEVGYDAIELRGNDVVEWLQSGRSLEDLASLLAQHGLTAPAMCSEAEVYSWHFGAPMQSSEFVAALDTFLERCQRLNTRILIFPVMHTHGTLDETVRNYKWLCERVAAVNMVAGLEFIGHVPKVADVRTAWEVIEAANRPNSGLVVDLFHFHRGGSRTEDLARIPADQLSIVHIDDAMSLPRDQLVGSKHRVYPGEGIAPVGEVLSLLRRQGYQGPYAVELFNEDYWAADPTAVARRARETTLAMLQ